MTSRKMKIIALRGCPFSENAVTLVSSWLRQNKIDHLDVQYITSPQKEVFKKKCGVSSFPVIYSRFHVHDTTKKFPKTKSFQLVGGLSDLAQSPFFQSFETQT